MTHVMTIEYLKCRADLNLEVDFGVNNDIGTIVTKWDLGDVSLGKWIVFIHNMTTNLVILGSSLPQDNTCLRVR